jgi:hypothetical protein
MGIGSRISTPARKISVGDDVTAPSLSLAYEAAAKRLGNDVRLTQLEGIDHEALFDPAVLAIATISHAAKNSDVAGKAPTHRVVGCYAVRASPTFCRPVGAPLADGAPV